MILPDTIIKEHQDNNSASRMPLVECKYPRKEVYIGPASVDLTLSMSFSVPKNMNIVKMDTESFYDQHYSKQYLLQPAGFVLASTQETVKLPDYISAFVQGRSSIGRLGLQIQNAGFIDAGFQGQITLELHNQGPNPILLEADTRICQIVFFQQIKSSKIPYQGKYQNQTGAVGSRLYLDLDKNFT